MGTLGEYIDVLAVDPSIFIKINSQNGSRRWEKEKE